MKQNQKETENLIFEITRIEENVGIYLIVSTQKPYANIVTEFIKVNIPSRIAFKVLSGEDSQVILDESGAEKLFGNGEMLFKQQGCIKPMRIQSACVSEKEISNVVNFLYEQLKRH